MSSSETTVVRAEPPRIVSVADGSPAAQAGLQPGDRVLSIDGLRPRDLIEWHWATDVESPSLEIERHAATFEVTVNKQAGEPIGIEVNSAVFDRVRTCDNHCEFCFIHQLPKGMRRSLYLKDDDYRLSFLYGNFTTLTRFTEADLERVIDERLSPLHVSIHAIDPLDRSRMLRNPRGAMSLRWLRAMLDEGINVRGQIVVCPGVNDGDVFERTMLGIADAFSDLDAVAVVPLGVSKFNGESAMRTHTTAEAEAIVDSVEEWQRLFTQLVGHPMVYAADEYYLMAGREFPAIESYGQCEMHEDGIGMAATFRAEFNNVVATTTSPQRGFFAAADQSLPSNPAAYTGLRATPVAVTLQPTHLTRNGITILTGEYGARVIAPLLDDRFPDVEIAPVTNEYFGGNTAVTGLMTGADISRVLMTIDADRRILIPDVCLSDDGRFLDGVRIEELPRSVDVIPTDGHSLRRALERSHR